MRSIAVWFDKAATIRPVLIALALTWLLGGLGPCRAQTESVLHRFTGAMDGFNPYSGLARDTDGNLYGTAFLGVPAGPHAPS
jgi:hypothetical protein